MGRRRRMGAPALALLLVTACTGAGASSTAPARGAVASTKAPPVASSVPATASPGPAAAGPPAASLMADGGDPVVGELGSYTWAGGGSDSPWLPGAPMVVGAGEPLTMRIDGDLPVESWTARRTPGSATSDAGAVEVASGVGDVGAVTFDAPPPGDWTVEVTVHVAGGGSASYAWRLEAT